MKITHINWIHIVDPLGKPILVYERYKQGAKGNNQALLSHFIYSIKKVALELKEDQVHRLVIGDNFFFLLKDSQKQVITILKTDEELEMDEIITLLNKIRLIYNEKYSNKIRISIAENLEILESFKNDVLKILNLGKKYLDFLTET